MKIRFPKFRKTRVELNFGHLEFNLNKLHGLCPGANSIVMVKADAYGHGALTVARYLEKCKKKDRIYAFGVANWEEAFFLRRKGIQKEIIVFSGVQSYTDLVRTICLEQNFIPVISSFSVFI